MLLYGGADVGEQSTVEGKIFREANFFINPLPNIDRYFVPLTGHSHKYGPVELLAVAPVHNVTFVELFSASRVL